MTPILCDLQELDGYEHISVSAPVYYVSLPRDRRRSKSASHPKLCKVSLFTSGVFISQGWYWILAQEFVRVYTESGQDLVSS